MERQFEITPDSRVFTEVYKEHKRVIANLPVAVWVQWPPVSDFRRSLTKCDCQIGFQFLETPENLEILKNAGMSPDTSRGSTLCLCFGRLIE